MAILCASLATSPLMASEHSKVMHEPDDARAPVPKTSYQSILPGTDKSYLQRTDAQRLPWRKLFTPEGDFLPQAEPEGMPMKPAASHSASGHPKKSMPVGSDARGVIRSIDRDRKRIKLKHGPIDRLEMPGMTMVFRVKDPALLDQVKKGDSVGFTVEVEGGTFFVTGFQK